MMKVKFQAILTVEAALAAVQNNGYALQFVEGAAMTEAVALAAVQNDGDALRYVLNLEWFKRIALTMNISIEF